MPSFRLFKNFDATLVLASLTIAFFIWLIAKHNETSEDTLTVAIKIIKANPKCQVEFSPQRAQVRVQYPNSLRSYVNNESFVIGLDVSNAHVVAGVDEFKDTPQTLTLDQVQPVGRLPAGIQPVQFMSANNIVISAKLHTREIQIEPQLTGRLAEGYELTGPPIVDETEQRRLRLMGPRDELSALPSSGSVCILRTEPIDLTGRSKSDSLYARILVPEGLGLVQKDSDRKILPEAEWRITVYLPIAEETVQRLFTGAPVDLQASNPRLRFVCVPSTTTVVVRGARSLVDSLSATSFSFRATRPLIERAGLVSEVPIRAQFADSVPERAHDEVVIISVDPSIVQLRVVAVEPDR